MIPREFLLVLWIAASVVSLMTSFVTFRRRRITMSLAVLGVSIGALGIVSFYVLLVFFPQVDYAIQVAWSRWTIMMMGLMILLGSTAGFILNKD